MNTNTASTLKMPSWLPWLVWGLPALFYFYEYFLQVSPGVMVPELMKAFNVNAAELGNLAAYYFYSYALMQIPVGVLLDRYGPRILLTIATAICMVGCLLFGMATNLDMAKIGRLLIGLGSAFAAIGCLTLAARWFPIRRFALLTGLTVMIAMLGAIGGQTPLAIFVSTLGWRTSMMVLGVIGGVIAWLIWKIVRDDPPQAIESQATSVSHVEQKSLLDSLKIVIKSKQTWLVAIYGGLVFAPTSIFGSLWGVPFLMAHHGLSRPAAAGVISMLFVGWAIGSGLSGWFSDTIGKRKLPMLLGAIGAFITITALIYLPQLSIFWINALLFLFGVFSSGFLPAFSIIREINPINVSGTALGFMNAVNMVGGALGQPLVGWLLDSVWNGKLEAGVRIYSIANFHFALAVLPICIALSLITLFFIRETHCESKYQ